MTVILPFSRICETVSIPVAASFAKVSVNEPTAHNQVYVTTSREVLIPDLLQVDHVEAICRPFGRQVDVTLRAERGGGNPEHVLLLDPFHIRLRDLVVQLTHGGR